MIQIPVTLSLGRGIGQTAGTM